MEMVLIINNKYHANTLESFLTGAPLQTLLGELKMLPQTPSQKLSDTLRPEYAKFARSKRGASRFFLPRGHARPREAPIFINMWRLHHNFWPPPNMTSRSASAP